MINHRTRRAARWDRAAWLLIEAGCWAGVFVIGAMVGAALAMAYLHRLGLA